LVSFFQKKDQKLCPKSPFLTKFWPVLQKFNKISGKKKLKTLTISVYLGKLFLND